MEGILNWISSTDASQISTYINFFFIAIGVIALIGFLFGLIRGIYRATSFFLCFGACILVIIFCTNAITNALYGFDITKIGIHAGDFTSAGEYIENMVTSYLQGQSSQEVVLDAQTISAIKAISFSFANIVVYMALFVLSLLIVAPLLHLLVYNILFRLIVSERKRKKHKKRPLGGLVTMVEAVVAFTLFIAPVTGVVNGLTKGLQDEEGKIAKVESDNEYYNAFYKVISCYNDSAVAKMFFTLNFGQDNSFDVSLMDYVTSSSFTTANGTTKTIKTYSELEGLSSLIASAISSGAIGAKIDYSLLITPSFINEALEYVGNSTLLQTLAGLGMTLVTNMNSVKGVIDVSGYDFYDLDWSSSTTSLQQIVNALDNANFFDNLQSSIKNGTSITDAIYFDDTNSAKLIESLESLGNMDSISSLMTEIIVSFAKYHNASISSNNNGASNVKARKNDDPAEDDSEETKGKSLADILNNIELPEEESFYSSIKWGDELGTLVNIFCELSTHYYAYTGNHLSLSRMGDAFSNSPLNFIMGIDTVKDYASVSEKYEKNVFINGGNYTTNVDGTQITVAVPGIKNIFGTRDAEDSNGLFDLQIINKIVDETTILGDVLGNIDLNSLLGESASEIDTSSIESVTDLVKDWKISSWKSEFGQLCDVLLPSLDLVDILSDSNNSIYDYGDNIEYLFTTIDDSKIMKTMIPSLLDSMIGSKIDFDGVTPNFENIENWALEGQCLNELLTTVKSLGSTDFSNIDWTNIDNITENQYNAAVAEGYTGSFDKYYVDNSKVNKLLTSVYKTQCIGGTYEEDGTRKDGIFSTMLEKIIKTALTSVDDKLDFDSCPEKDLINLDFNLGENVVYTNNGTNIYVSWLSEDDTYLGEIANITLLVSEAGKIDTSSTDMSSISGALKRMNSCYILRDVITLVINDKVSDVSSEGITKEFLDRADFSVFHNKDLSLTPYKYVEDAQGNKTIEYTNNSTLSNRKEEVDARQNEISSITDIFDYMDDVNDALNATDPAGVDNFYSAKKLTANKALTSSLSDSNPLKTTEEKSILEKITSCLENSAIFNTPTYDSDNKRVGTTSFEYLFQYITGGSAIDVSNFLVNLNDDPSILYEISSENGWSEEITNFNSALYNILNNDLLDVISNSSDMLNDVSTLIESGKTPIQDLFASMNESKILSQSIGYALDKQFLTLITDNIGLDTDTYEVDSEIYEKVYSYYSNKTSTQLASALTLYGASADSISLASTNASGAFWKNEAQSLEEAVVAISSIDFANINLDDSTLSIDGIVDSIRHSLCLNYLNEDDGSVVIVQTSAKQVVSVYQSIAIKTVTAAKEALSSLLVPTGKTDYTTVNDIASYDDEINIVRNLLKTYSSVKDLVNKDANTITSADVTKLDNLMDLLFSSTVYNYCYYGKSHKSASDTNNEHSYYERIVMKLDDTLASALGTAITTDKDPNPLSSTTSEDITYSTKVIDFDNDESTKKNSAYQYEASLITRAINKYIDAKDMINDSDIVDNLTTTGEEAIKGLFDVLRESAVFNYPEVQLSVYSDNGYYKTAISDATYSKHSDNSLYEHVAIYLVEKMNTALNSTLSLDVSEAGAKRIKSYTNEIDTIFNVIEAYQGISSYLSSGYFNLTDSTASAISTGFKKMLQALNDSDVYFYIRTNSWNNRNDELTIFEQLISKLLVTAGLDDSIYNAENPLQSGLANGEAVVNKRIVEISNNQIKLESEQDESLVWLEDGGEIDKLCAIINNFSLYTFDSSSSELSSYIAYDSVNDTYSGLLPTVNDSYLLHDIVSTMTREFIIKAKIDNEAHTKGDVNQSMLIVDGTSINYYGIDTDSVKFASKVTRWNADVYKLVSIIDKIDEITDCDSVMDIAASKPFETVLPIIANTELFSGVIDQITVSLLFETKVNITGIGTKYMSDFITNSTVMLTVYNKAKDVWTSAYTNAYVDDAPTNISWSNESAGLDDFIVGLATFGTNYATYLVQKNYGLSPTYPTWSTTIENGALAQHMSQTSQLQNVFPA